MKYKPDNESLANYLSGECSKQEKLKIEGWIKSDTNNQKLIKLMTKAWEVKQTKYHEWNPMNLWEKVKKNAGILSESKLNQESFSLKHAIKFSNVWKIAAIFIFAIALPYYLFFNPLNKNKSNRDLQTILVEKGKYKIVTLSDGSKITLDAGSSFSYLKTYNNENREVFLNGEGYFEITPNDNFTFIVHANDAIVKVIGTKFNVRAWKKNIYVKVTVSEGKVVFNSETGNEEDAVFISKGQLSELKLKGKPTKPIEVDVQNYIGWINHEINFEDTPLNEILFQIERWYDVNFALADSTIEAEHLNIHIQNNSLSELLDMISMLTDMRYEQKDKLIYLGR